MTRFRAAAWLLASALAFPFSAADVARADDCPEILGFGQLSFEQHFDPNDIPDKTGFQATFVPIVAIHDVALNAIAPTVIQDQAWCRGLTGDTIALDAAVDATGLGKGTAHAAISSGTFAVYAEGATPESDSQMPRSGSSLVQIGYRDVIQVGGGGTDPVPLTLHRSVNGSWTVREPHGNTLYELGTRTFELTIHELANPNVVGPNDYTRRLVIDDTENAGLVNGEQAYVFDATPGHTLVLTLYLEAGVMCSPNLSYGQPPQIYNGCFGYVDFGQQFGAPIGLTIEAPAGHPLTADSGYSYVPEPGAAELEAAVVLALVALRRRPRTREAVSDRVRARGAWTPPRGSARR